MSKLLYTVYIILTRFVMKCIYKNMYYIKSSKHLVEKLYICLILLAWNLGGNLQKKMSKKAKKRVLPVYIA